MRKRFSIFLETSHMKSLAKIGKQKGLKPAQLVRLAIAEFVERETKKGKVDVVDSWAKL